MRNLICGLVAVASLSLIGCGVSAGDVVGTWTYDDGSKATSVCGTSTVEVDYSGTSLTFAAGTENDLVVTSIGSGDSTIDFAALGCEPGYNLEGGMLVVGTGEGSKCTTDEADPNIEVTTTGELTWSVESGTHMVLAGSETSSYHYVDGSVDDFSCTTTQTGGLTKAE